MTQDEQKQQVAEAALDFLQDGIDLGVGTGSTVNHFIDALPQTRLRINSLVASSEETRERLENQGFRVKELAEVGTMDLYVDGADEANPHLHLIKGGGGALTREKIIAAASRKFVCIIDQTKWVKVLGAFPLPVEVIPMARSYVARQLVALGGQPEYRQGFVTDNGNQILDIHNLKITDPPEMERRINQIAGVVTVGIFAGRPADMVLMAGPGGVERKDGR